MSDLGRFLTQVIAVAIGAILALLANRGLDNRKADREYANVLFDAVRRDVREAMVVASEYWAGELSDSKKIILEAQIRILQAEINRGSRLLDDHCSPAEISLIDKSVRDFLKLLTGSDFEAAHVKANKEHIIQLTSVGSRLRSEIAKTRRSQLNR